MPPVGMTLQQLYAPPSFDDHDSTAKQQNVKDMTAPASMGMAMSRPMSLMGSSTITTHSSSQAVSDPSNPAHDGYDDRADDNANNNGYENQGEESYDNRYSYDHHQAGYQGYSQGYNQSYAPSKQNEEYVADPLPFEYRKYADVTKPQDHRMQSGMVEYGNAEEYNTNNSPYAHQAPKSLDDQQRQAQYLPAGYSGDRYAQPQEMHPHYSHAGSHLAQQQMYATQNASIGGLLHMAQAYPPSIPEAQPKKEASDFAAHPVEYTPAPQVPQGASQEAMIKVKTPLKPKYWRNGRRNLQCFPSCKVFGDYSAIKIEDLKQHDFMWGKCRGSVVTEVTLNSNVAFDDILILGRVHSLENIPVAFEEAVIRECMLGRMVEPDVMDTMKENWIIGERLPDFVQQDANVACFEFKPKVWKYQEDMAQGKCKRRNVKYYVQFEAYVMINSGERKYFACIGSGMSTSFEVGSSRVLARQKRKAATTVVDQAPDMKNVQQPQNPEMAMQQMHHPMMVPTSHMMVPPQLQSMPPQGLFMPHYQNTQHNMQPPQRGLSSAFPLSHYHQEQVPIHHHQMHHQAQHQQHQQTSPSGMGRKRKMMSDLPAIHDSRGAKMLKSMNPVPTSIPI